MYKRFIKHGGLGLIEAVIAVAIIGTALVATVGVFNLFLRSALRTTPEIKGVFLLEEGLEAVRSIRDFGWSTEITPLALGTPYELVWSSGRWVLDSGPHPVDDFTRGIVFSAVNRDTEGHIVESGGTDDPNTREVTVTITRNGDTRTVSMYITNVFDEE